jgi:predicted nucleic acid-binding protein
MSRILVDTNILVYLIDEESAFFERARQVVEKGEYQLVTTSKNLIEFLAVTTKFSGYNLSTGTALQIVGEFIDNFEIIYPSQESLAIFFDLMTRYQPKGLRVHDIEIISIGLANGLFDVATFNAKDFKSVQEISVLKI